MAQKKDDVKFPSPRRLSAILAVIFLILTIGSAWFYRRQQSQLQIKTEQFLSAVAKLKVNEIIQWRSERLAYPASLSESPIFLGRVREWMTSHQQADAQKLLDRFRSLQSHYSFWDVLLTDADGRINLSLSGQAGSMIERPAVGYVAQAFAAKRPVMSDLLPAENNYPNRVYIITPLADKSPNPAIPFGAVILVYDIRSHLYPLIQSWPTSSKSAESVLVRRDGDSVLFLSELRYSSDASFKKRIPLSRKSDPAVMAVLGQKGVVEGLDYRDVEVFADIQPIPGSPWFLVSKLDKSEALEEWHSLTLLRIGLTFSLFIAASAITWAAWQYSMKSNYILRLKMEEDRRESEEQYRITLMSIGDGVIITDGNGHVTLLNSVAENLTGWKQDEAQGKPISEVFNIYSERTHQKVEDPVKQVISSGQVVGLANHTLLLSHSGKEYPIKDSSAPIRNDKGDLIGVVLVFRDQTVERMAERLLQSERDRLQESVALLTAMGRAAKIGGWELDVDTLEGIWTDEMYRIFELPPGQKPNITDAIRLYYHPDEQARFSEAVKAAIEKQESYDLEMRFITAKKRHMWVRAICNPIGENGKTKRLVGVFQDITERKTSEEQRHLLQEQLQQAMKMEAVGRLAGGVAHDFNNLLTGISGYADLLISSLDPSNTMLNDLKEIQKASQSAIDLARQLLVFSRKQLIEPRMINLNDLLSRLHRMLMRSIGEDIVLKMLPQQPLGSVKVDPGQFEQILINLAINARDAMPNGGELLISTSNVDLDEKHCATHTEVLPGSYVMLEVRDNGHGMSREVKEHLFEPFFTTKPKGRGTGLGLATIYGAVKQANGSIEVDSEEGEGATFRIYLPRLAALAEPLEHGSPFALGMPGGEETILLVEDERIVRELAVKILKRLGYNILYASDGAQAIDVAKEYKSPIDLLMTDIVMPGMNGRQLADHLIQLHPEMKILYTSGYTDAAISHHGIIEEDLNFIAKPYSLHDLSIKIRKLLDQFPH
jgi:two-component system, cell cycle sensor histidine kinase and response regulator CckA